MKNELLNFLRDPVAGTPLRVESGGDLERGCLVSSDGARYPIEAGIPRFVLTEDPGQLQTQEAFGFKWSKRDTYDTDALREFTIEWFCNKYAFGDEETLGRFFGERERIIDVGCGSGFSSSLYLRHPAWTGKAMWVGVDISSAVDVAWDRLHEVKNTHFVQADAMQLPFADGSFDTIFSEGVLHHTPSTREALLSAARLLAPGGEILFYVYRKKAPLREYADDYIRDQLEPMTDAEAWDAMRPLTKMGQALAELKADITIPEDVPVLGIEAGTYDLQRLLYYNVAKMFWNENLSFEENVHINFDWYRPKYAHRQSAEEVRAWCSEAGLEIANFHEEGSGFAVRATRP